MTWKRKEKTWYHGGHILSTVITKVFLRPRIVGKEHIPSVGTVLIAPNHRSFLDIPVLGCATFRPMRFMAKKDLFKNKLVKWYFETNGSFSVDKEGSDPAAVRKAVKYLANGDALVVFPEGKRNKEDSVGELSPGVGFLAIKGNSPVVPVGISGVDRIFVRTKFFFKLNRASVVIGAPITAHLESEGTTSEKSERLLQELEGHLDSLYEESQENLRWH